MNTSRLVIIRAVAGLLVVLQSACDMSTGPVSLTMSIDPTTITLGEDATITWEWKTPEGGICDARGAWSGNRKSKGSKVVTPTETGTVTYGLECFEDFDALNHRTRTASVTLTVNPAAASAKAATVRAMAAAYEFTTIDFPGADRTEAYGINNAGQVVGYFFDAAGQHGFIKDGDTYTAFDVGPEGTSAHGINDAAEIVGYEAGQGFLKVADTIDRIVAPSSYFTVAWGINNAGNIVGTFSDDLGAHGFLKDGDTFLPIDGPEALFTEATGINDGGEVVGNFIGSGGVYQAFRMSAGQISVIEVPGATITEARGINSSGQVVGSFVDAAGVVHGYVLGDDGVSILDVPGAGSPNFTQARGINDAGSVVGWFYAGGGEVHAFLATPADTTTIAIDIVPDASKNVLNPRSRGTIWVGILSDMAAGPAFDPVSQVDASTVKFGPGSAEHVRYKLRDVNRDGLADLLLQFRVRDAGIPCGATSASLTGAMFDGQEFTGTDRIKTVCCR